MWISLLTQLLFIYYSLAVVDVAILLSLYHFMLLFFKLSFITQNHRNDKYCQNYSIYILEAHYFYYN